MQASKTLQPRATQACTFGPAGVLLGSTALSAAEEKPDRPVDLGTLKKMRTKASHPQRRMLHNSARSLTDVVLSVNSEKARG